jgi:hypothetical protein
MKTATLLAIMAAATLALSLGFKADPAPIPPSPPIPTELQEFDLVDIATDTISDFDPYTKEERERWAADRKRRGPETFSISLANDGTNLVLLTWNCGAKWGVDGQNRLLIPLTNRFVQATFYRNGEMEMTPTNSAEEITGNVNLQSQRGFWVTTNEPYPGDGRLWHSNITMIHAD